MHIGDVGEVTLVVGPGDSAKALARSPEEDFPAVLATTRMIALMELAAAKAMRGLLRAGQLSVGVGSSLYNGLQVNLERRYPTSGSFGLMTSRSGERQIQLSASYSF